ncbi:MAG: T9SS type A sorting domain-containing protein [Ignavibacteriales bacterium]|nr:T9SS type A sorting domain-containing protein [Ignavibacteriales bacterium]
MGLSKHKTGCATFGEAIPSEQVAIVGKLRRHKVCGYRVWPFSFESILVALFLSFPTAFSQDVEITMPGPRIVLRAIPFDMPSKIGPPARFWETKALQKMGAVKSASISVTYTGFDSAAQAAFQHAVDIWETLITSSMTIKVNAEFEALETGVLGSAGPTALYRNVNNEPFTDTWYAVALAEKLQGTNLNMGNDEIDASFNSSFSDWYFGIDGITPAGKYDFVTVVMHELCHGLGFVGSMTVTNDTTGSWGYSGFPMIFDRFGVNGSSDQLINTSLFPNPSTDLGTQLKSENIYFNGSWAVQENGNSNPKLYAPSTWQQGSSFSHLDESTFPVGDTNSLMTPFLNSAESVHDPGPISLGIFQDMGWTTVLPVQLAYFNANVSASSVQLQWRTEAEINTYGFSIERRALAMSDESWSTVGFIKGQGTTSSPHDYSFVDQILTPGRYLYRMKQRDFGGAFEYFGNVEVEILAPEFFALEQNFPNPFNPATTIRYRLPSRSLVRLEIFNALGQPVEQLVNSEQAAGYREVTWRANVSSGTYFYRLEAVASGNRNERFVETKKLVVLK